MSLAREISKLDRRRKEIMASKTHPDLKAAALAELDQEAAQLLQNVQDTKKAADAQTKLPLEDGPGKAPAKK